MGGCLSEIGRFILFLACVVIFAALTGTKANLMMSALCYPLIRLIGLKLWGEKENNNNKNE